MKSLFAILGCFLLLAMLAACSAPKHTEKTAEQTPPITQPQPEPEEPQPEPEEPQPEPEEPQPEPEEPQPEPEEPETETLPAEPPYEPDMTEPPAGRVLPVGASVQDAIELMRLGCEWTTPDPEDPSQMCTIVACGASPVDARDDLPIVRGKAALQLLWDAMPQTVRVMAWKLETAENDPYAPWDMEPAAGEDMTLAPPEGEWIYLLSADWDGFGNAEYAFRWAAE